MLEQKQSHSSKWIFLCLGLIFWTNAVRSQVQITAPDTVAKAGAQIFVPVKVQGIQSHKVYGVWVVLIYDDRVAKVIGTSNIGSVTSSWGAPVVNTETNGKVSFAMAGTTPISENGVLLLIKFQLTGLPGQISPLRFDTVVFNEGNPTAVPRDGLLRIQGALPNDAPLAMANGPYSGRVGVPVVFSSSGSNDPDGDPLTFGWSFGDGQTAVGRAPAHIYSRAGTFTVILAVDDGKGATGLDTTYVTIANVTGVEDPRHFSTPQEFVLEQNYPNPFNPDTRIRFHLPVSSEVSIKIFDLRGQEITTIYQGLLASGMHNFVWNGIDAKHQQVGAGIYFSRLSAKPILNPGREVILTRRMTLLR